MTGQDLVNAFSAWVKKTMEEYGTGDLNRELTEEDKEEIAGNIEAFANDEFEGDDAEAG